jgi:type II secretory pathway component PulM
LQSADFSRRRDRSLADLHGAMAPTMTGVDAAPHQIALTFFAFFIAVIIWIVVVGPDADPKSRPETTVVEAAMESTSVEASEATTMAASKAAHVAATSAAKTTHMATSAAEATAVASTTTTTTTAAATVGRQGDIRAQQAN